MADLRELYQEMIVDHSRQPRNFGPLHNAGRHARGFNPLCGDQVTLHLKLDGDIIEDARFEGVGCAISIASASLMTEALKGRTEKEAAALFDRFHALVTGRSDGPQAPALGKLEALGGVADFPTRVKCATLPWHALLAALQGDTAPVSTEDSPNRP